MFQKEGVVQYKKRTLPHKVSLESSYFKHVALLLIRMLFTSAFLMMLVFYGHI